MTILTIFLGIIKNILAYEYTWTIVFYSAILLVLVVNWKKFEFQGILALYRTSIGLKFMQNMAEKHRELIKLIALIGIGVGFIGLIVSIPMIMITAYYILVEPISGNPLALPGTTIAGTGGVVFPLVIGWITLFIVIIVHEFSHGVVANAYGIKVKSSGIAFIGPILGAFVEPDEKQLTKERDIPAYSVMAAGPFSNILLAVLILILTAFVVNPFIGAISYNDGVLITPQEGYPAMEAGLNAQTKITVVNGQSTLNLSAFMGELIEVLPNDTINISNEDITYSITAVPHPQNESRGYLGINIINNQVSRIPGSFGKITLVCLEWISRLFFWLWFISINIAIINLFPVFVTDGARMLQVAMQKLYPKKGLKVWAILNYGGLVLLLMILLLPVMRSIISVFI